MSNNSTGIVLLLLISIAACSSSSDDNDGNSIIDTDADLVSNEADNCPFEFNPNQTASIGNATVLGDACDDEDVDDVVDEIDNCPLASNSDQADRDGNGIGDACDSCLAMSIVADIWPGSGNSYPGELILLQDKLYFSADDGLTGRELWMYDPASGASQVADIIPDTAGSTLQYMTALDNKLYFEVVDAETGSELWVHDPADRSTGILAATGFSPGNEPEYRDIFALDGMLYFSAENGLNWDLWMYDPETGAAYYVDTSDDWLPLRILELDGKTFYFKNDELRVYDMDDPTANPFPAFDFNYGFTWTTILATMNGKLYFTANNDSSTAYYPALWSYDPVNPLSGALMVANINVTSKGRYARDIQVLGDNLFLFAFSADGGGPPELWVYEQETGASPIVDDAWSYPDEIAVLDGKIYIARDERHEVWMYDPANPAAGTTMVASAGDGEDDDYWVSGMTGIAGKLYFNGNGDLWMYDPDTGATILLDSSGDIGSGELIELDGKLYFSATDAEHGGELWVRDPACSP